MLISFLAALEDGVALSSEVASRIGASRRGSGEGAAKAGLPGIASLLGLSLSTEGRYTRENTSEDTVEEKFVRQHTASSLFNRLRALLLSQGLVQQIDSLGQIDDVLEGDLVEVRGEILTDPMHAMLRMFAQLATFIPTSGSMAGAEDNPFAAYSAVMESGESSATSGDPGAQQTVAILKALSDEQENGPVADLLLRSSLGFSAVLTASRSHFSPETEAYLLGGRFAILAKVTGSVPEGETINLLRRSVLGRFGESGAMFSELGGTMEASGISMGPEQTTVPGPALQLLPLAIFI
jgi:hypothetical protein